MKQLLWDVAFVAVVCVVGPPIYAWGRFLEWRDDERLARP